MDIKQFKENKTGELVRVSGVPGITDAFIPNPMPPDWEDEQSLYRLLVEANKELARLDGIGRHLPNPQLLIQPLHHLEAQMSSALEGTITQPEQQMLFDLDPEEAGGGEESKNDFLEVSNYKKALRLRVGTYANLPISLRLIKELHHILLEGVRGEQSDAGEFRRLMVQIGRPARYVPPPVNEVPRLLDNLEKFIHLDTPQYDPLIKAFIIHYQFEAIHPFSDGNGRVGRLLLSLMIQEYCNLSNQWLYLSPYFKRNRSEYIDRLLGVSTEGDWAGWLAFCLQGVVEESRSTQDRCRRLLAYSQEFHDKLKGCGRSNARLIEIVNNLLISPILTVPLIQRRYSVTRTTANRDIQCLTELGIIEELGERWARAKAYYAPAISSVIFEGL